MGDPLGFLNTQSVVKYQRNCKGDPLERKKFRKKVSQCRKTERRDLWGFSTFILSQNIKKLKWGKIFIFGKKISVPKKTERGDPLGFSNIHSVAKQQKNEGRTLWVKFFLEKVSQCRKKIERGDPLVSPMVCYAGKQEKPFWFSSLDQIVQFGAIIFCRAFKNYFGQFVWIEKKEKPL